MLDLDKVTIKGQTFVLVPLERYEQMVTAPSPAGRVSEDDLPPYPPKDAKGLYPALEYTRVEIARRIIIERRQLALSQSDLARAAGVRVETLNRIEKAKVTPDTATLAKLDAAMKKAAQVRASERSPKSARRRR